MRGGLLTGLLAVSLCFAPFTVAAQVQSHHPESGEAQAIQEAHQDHWKKTAGLRQQVRLKQLELAAALANPKATEEELLKKQKELQEGRAELEKEHLVFMVRMHRKYPDFMETHGMTGSGMGMGCGMMGGGGMGMGCSMMGGMGCGMMGGAMGRGMGGGHDMGPGMKGGMDKCGCMGHGMMCGGQ